MSQMQRAAVQVNGMKRGSTVGALHHWLGTRGLSVIRTLEQVQAWKVSRARGTYSCECLCARASRSSLSMRTRYSATCRSQRRLQRIGLGSVRLLPVHRGLEDDRHTYLPVHCMYSVRTLDST